MPQIRNTSLLKCATVVSLLHFLYFSCPHSFVPRISWHTQNRRKIPEYRMSLGQILHKVKVRQSIRTFQVRRIYINVLCRISELFFQIMALQILRVILMIGHLSCGTLATNYPSDLFPTCLGPGSTHGKFLMIAIRGCATGLYRVLIRKIDTATGIVTIIIAGHHRHHAHLTLLLPATICLPFKALG